MVMIFTKTLVEREEERVGMKTRIMMKAVWAVKNLDVVEANLVGMQMKRAKKVITDAKEA